MPTNRAKLTRLQKLHHYYRVSKIAQIAARCQRRVSRHRWRRRMLVAAATLGAGAYEVEWAHNMGHSSSDFGTVANAVAINSAGYVLGTGHFSGTV